MPNQRDYLPALGRWLQPDPIGQGGGLNIYAYCGNDPVNKSDPSGLDSTSVITPTGSHIPLIGDRKGNVWGSAIGVGIGGYGGGSTYADAPKAGTTGIRWSKRRTVVIAQEGPVEEGVVEEAGSEEDNILHGSRRGRNVEGERAVEKGKELADLLRSIFSRLKAVFGGGDAETESEDESYELKPYREGKGHHIPAKSAFRGDPNYDANEALAIPKQELESENLNHSDITGTQARLYRAYAQGGKPLTWEAMRSIETQASWRGGANFRTAARTVDMAIANLRASGASPTRVPWGN